MGSYDLAVDRIASNPLPGLLMMSPAVYAAYQSILKSRMSKASALSIFYDAAQNAGLVPVFKPNAVRESL